MNRFIIVFLDILRQFHLQNMVTKEIMLLIMTLGSVLAVQSSYYSVQQDTQITSSSANLGVLQARSKQECSVLCLRDKQCASAKFKTGIKQCRLHGDLPQYSPTDDGQTTTITLRGSCPNGHAKISTQGKPLVQESKINSKCSAN